MSCRKPLRCFASKSRRQRKQAEVLDSKPSYTAIHQFSERRVSSRSALRWSGRRATGYRSHEVAKTQAKSVGAIGTVAGVHFLRAEVPDASEPQLSELRHEASRFHKAKERFAAGGSKRRNS
jgi:hypothetical protein